MTDCVCPIAGYCERHKVNKSEHWHSLCQTRDKYFAAWEEGRGPGQQLPPIDKQARKERIQEAAARRKRLVGWLQFFHTPSDRGLGDTAQRLVLLARRKSEAHTLIKRLLSQCSCSRVDAVARLNQENPYH